MDSRASFPVSELQLRGGRWLKIRQEIMYRSHNAVTSRYDACMYVVWNRDILIGCGMV